MDEGKARVALADAMQLHDERLEIANGECRRLRAELEAAEMRREQVRQARHEFIRYVRPTVEG